MARVLTGQSVGLVLSGGGARAYAHVGAVKALRERGVPIDFVGGVSMGAIVGAGVGLGWDEAELKELIERFTAGPFGDRVPHAVEPPFALVLGGQVVRGRIDAVYQTGGGFLVVDWKTNRRQTADPLQLAIYRLAWAELAGVPVDRVEAAFFYVRSGDLVEHRDLPGRAELAAIVAGEG